MQFTTIYQRTIKRRATGLADTNWYCYTTKTLTDTHHRLRADYPGAETWHCREVILDFFPGIPLPKPLVMGGVRIGVKPQQPVIAEEK